MVKIMTDSTNDLPKELLDKLGIEVVPLYVNFDDDSYRDGVDLTTEQLYEEVEKRGMLPKTAAVSVGDLMVAFEPHIKNGDEIVYTGISMQMSRTFQNALMAKEELETDKIYVVDSKNLSSGIGLLLLKACKDRDNGLSGKEIAENMERNADLVLSQFAIERMDYLHKGGRCSSIAAIAATVLRIKPIIQVRGGRMSVQQKPIGKMKTALDRMIAQIEGDRDRLDTDHILVTHSLAPESAAYIIPILKEKFPGVDILETNAGCVISSHCGKGTIGILYMVKE